MEWFNAIISIISGVAVTIPLIIKLVATIKSYVKSQNYDLLIGLVMENMKVAESKFATGAEKKEWVMSLLSANARAVNYDLTADDIEKISKMIDEICKTAKMLRKQ